MNTPYIALEFPEKGIDVTMPLDMQPPLTCVVGKNVRTCESVTERDRGGSRSGLSKLVDATVSGS